MILDNFLQTLRGRQEKGTRGFRGGREKEVESGMEGRDSWLQGGSWWDVQMKEIKQSSSYR